jgi:glycerophosphoryl diester phosphodiesterase
MKNSISDHGYLFVALYFILFISACERGYSGPEKFLLIAHRGGVVDDTLSENSLKGLEEAVRRGYTHIEIDANVTKDGHVVCFHDKNLMREAGVDKNISELTLAEIKQIRLLRDNELIPTFEEYCVRAEGRINLMIDIKGVDDLYLEKVIMEIDSGLTRHDLLKDALFITNRVAINNQEKVCDWFLGRARTSLRGSLAKNRILASTMPDLGRYHFIFNSPKDFTKEMVDEFHRMGLMVIPSVNTGHYKSGDPMKRGLADIEKMMDWGVDGLQIDSCYDPLVFSRLRTMKQGRPRD